MQYAIINNKPVRAGDYPPGSIQPGPATCPYCGKGVMLRNNASNKAGYAIAWVHLDRPEAAACEAARAIEQAELYAALGGGQ